MQFYTFLHNNIYLWSPLSHRNYFYHFEKHLNRSFKWGMLQACWTNNFREIQANILSHFLADSNYYTLCMFKQCIEMSFLLLCNTKSRSTGICLFSFALTCTTKKIIFLEHCLLVGISWLKYHRNLEIAKNWSW